VRTLKVSALMLVALAFLASSALAGSSCNSAKVTQTASGASACMSNAFAGAQNSCSASKAKLAELVEIEATRLPSGALVILYQGKTPDAVAYLQASAAGPAGDFCCPTTRQIATGGEANVEIAKIDKGAVIIVTAKTQELVDKFADSYLTLASAK